MSPAALFAERGWLTRNRFPEEKIAPETETTAVAIAIDITTVRGTGLVAVLALQGSAVLAGMDTKVIHIRPAVAIARGKGKIDILGVTDEEEIGTGTVMAVDMTVMTAETVAIMIAAGKTVAVAGAAMTLPLREEETHHHLGSPRSRLPT